MVLNVLQCRRAKANAWRGSEEARERGDPNPDRTELRKRCSKPSTTRRVEIRLYRSDNWTPGQLDTSTPHMDNWIPRHLDHGFRTSSGSDTDITFSSFLLAPRLFEVETSGVSLVEFSKTIIPWQQPSQGSSSSEAMRSREDTFNQESVDKITRTC